MARYAYRIGIAALCLAGACTRGSIHAPTPSASPATSPGSAALQSTATPAYSSPPTNCKNGHWPDAVQGRPTTLHSGGEAGFYIWHGPLGWYLRTTTPARLVGTFDGTITSSGDATIRGSLRNDKADVITASGKTITFSLRTHGAIDGFSFSVGCTNSVAFDLKLGNASIPAERIHIGRVGLASANPVTVTREQ